MARFVLAVLIVAIGYVVHDGQLWFPASNERVMIGDVPTDAIPTPRPFTGLYEPNDLLKSATRLADGQVEGPGMGTFRRIVRVVT